MKFLPLLLLLTSCSSFIHWVDRYDRPALKEEKPLPLSEDNGDKFCKKCCPCASQSSTNTLPSAMVAPAANDVATDKKE